MRNLVILSIVLLLGLAPAHAAVLVQSANGTLVSKTSLAAAATAADAAGKTVIVTSPLSLTANLVWPADRELKIEKGGVITTTGYTLTIQTKLRAGRYQVFSGTGQVKFTAASDWNDHTQVAHTTTVYPEWWGTGADALQLAAYSISAQTAATTSPTYLGGVVEMANTHYNVTSTLIIPDHVLVTGPTDGGRQAAIVATGSWTAADPVVQIGRVLGTQYWSHGAQLKNCTVDGNYKANTGVYSASANEASGVDGLIIRNTLLQGIQWQDAFSAATDPRLIHNFIRNVQIFFPVASQVAYYPTPANCFGVVISGTRTAINYATGFEVHKVTVSAAGGQNDAAPTLIGAGFAFAGISGISLSDSHAEYAVVGVRLGNSSYPVFNTSVRNYDDYSENENSIEINHANSTGIILENIDSNTCPVILDDNTNGVELADRLIVRYTVGNTQQIGTSTTTGRVLGLGSTASTVNHIFSRQQSGTYTGPAGTALLVENTVGAGAAIVTLAGGSGSSAASSARIQAQYEGGSLTTLLELYGGEIYIENGRAGRKVSVPATATSTCKLGEWAADATHHYDCTATNTWRRVAHSAW